MKEEELKRAKEICDTIKSSGFKTTLMYKNETGDISIIVDNTADINVLIKDENKSFEPLLSKLKELDYSIDLNTPHGLGCVPYLIRADLINKTVKRPFLASVNHLQYLMNEESVLLKDAVDNFDEIFISKNENLIESLTLWSKKQRRGNGNA